MDDELKEAIKKGYPCSVIHFDEKGNVTHTEKYNLKNVRPSKWQIESLARCFLPQIREYFATEEGQREFERWQKENM
ncbi:MAG: hypothetical protein IJE00_06665 [Clostridia bacterium]|nr:hypothetical protein [Clostridia bacterium]